MCLNTTLKVSNFDKTDSGLLKTQSLGPPVNFSQLGRCWPTNSEALTVTVTTDKTPLFKLEHHHGQHHHEISRSLNSHWPTNLGMSWFFYVLVFFYIHVWSSSSCVGQKAVYLSSALGKPMRQKLSIIRCSSRDAFSLVWCASTSSAQMILP